MFGSGATALIISNREVDDFMKIVKSLEESGLLIKYVSDTIKNEAKKQKIGLTGMLWGTLAASILGNMLAGKHKIAGGGVKKAGEGFIWAGEGTTITGKDFHCHLIL